MNLNDFNALDTQLQALVTDAYLDGYASAIDAVESITMRIGDASLDAAFVSNRDSIVAILQHNYNILNNGVPGVTE